MLNRYTKISEEHTHNQYKKSCIIQYQFQVLEQATQIVILQNVNNIKIFDFLMIYMVFIPASVQ